MDSRDSSTSSTAAANRDGEDDGVLSAIAKEAAKLFESRKYAECISVMSQILQKKGDDPKVLHNFALAEFFRDGCSDSKKLLNALTLVKKKFEELASGSGEQGEPVNSTGNKSTATSKGTNTTNQLSDANSSRVVLTDEFDSSVATHNIAVMWYHLHEHSKVLSILGPLYNNIEPIDETTAVHICLLLLDALLASQDASRSVDVFNYLEKAFGVGSGLSQGDHGNTVQQHSGNSAAKSTSVSSGSAAADISIVDQTAIANSSESPLSRTLSEETLEYETMLKTLDISGQNIERPASLSTSNEFSSSSVGRSIPTVDLKLELQLYKVQILLLTRNLKLAKREVKHAIDATRGRDSSMALLLKSQLEHARGNPCKAIKLLMASSNQTETGFSSMFNNNLGCIYLQLGKPYLSNVFFSKALASCLSCKKEKSLELSTLPHDRSLFVMYNCGMQNLECGNPILAARCFQRASLVFHNRPLLWLRLAECGLMALEKGFLKTDGSSDTSGLRVSVIGRGKWRHLALDGGTVRKGLVDFVEDGLSLVKEGPPKLSLSFIRQCLLNALHLLNCVESGLCPHSSMEENDTSKGKNMLADLKAATVSASFGQISVDAKERGTSQENIQSSLCFYEDTRKKENVMLKQVLLANLAFVELELENPLMALSAARSVLEVPDHSKIITFLGHIYAAEALCLLDRSKEASELLSSYLSGGNNVQMPYTREDLDQWRVQKTVSGEEANGGSVTGKAFPLDGIKFLKPEVAQGTLLANFAAVAALQGQLEQARQFATQALSIIPGSPEATLTGIYVDLMLGKSQDAISKLKQCNQVRFVSSSVTIDKTI